MLVGRGKALVESEGRALSGLANKMVTVRVETRFGLVFVAMMLPSGLLPRFPLPQFPLFLSLVSRDVSNSSSARIDVSQNMHRSSSVRRACQFWQTCFVGDIDAQPAISSSARHTPQNL